MSKQQLKRLGGLILVLGILALLKGSVGLARANGQTIRIGILGDILNEVPDALLATMQQPFGKVMAQQTGLRGELVRSGDANDLAQQLAEDKVQLGIFYGIDFAWAQQKYPDLKPLMICVNKHPEPRAKLVVGTETKVADFAGLRSQTVTLPKLNQRHCEVYFEGLCRSQGLPPERFAGKLLQSGDFEEALDQVVDGIAHATVVDQAALEYYQRLKPGRAAWLKVLEKSMAFPCACVAYHARNGLGAATLQRFKQGMTNANQSDVGKRLFTLFRMTAFEPVPANYEQRLKEVLKFYPAPAETAARGDTPTE